MNVDYTCINRLREILVVDWSSQSPEGNGSVSTASLILTPTLLKRVQPDGLNVSVAFNPVSKARTVFLLRTHIMFSS